MQCLFVFFVCLGRRQGEADELSCNPLQRVGMQFIRSQILLLNSKSIGHTEKDGQTSVEVEIVI